MAQTLSSCHRFNENAKGILGEMLKSAQVEHTQAFFCSLRYLPFILLKLCQHRQTNGS